MHRKRRKGVEKFRENDREKESHTYRNRHTDRLQGMEADTVRYGQLYSGKTGTVDGEERGRKDGRMENALP